MSISTNFLKAAAVIGAGIATFGASSAMAQAEMDDVTISQASTTNETYATAASCVQDGSTIHVKGMKVEINMDNGGSASDLHVDCRSGTTNKLDAHNLNVTFRVGQLVDVDVFSPIRRAATPLPAYQAPAQPAGLPRCEDLVSHGGSNAFQSVGNNHSVNGRKCTM